MAIASPPEPPIQYDAPPKKWTEKISRSGYFLAALLLHLVIFLMVATLVIFPAFKPPTDDFKKTFVPSAAPPPPPPPQQQTVEMPTHTVSAPTSVIDTPNAETSFSVPMPQITPDTTPVDVTQKIMQKIQVKTEAISPARLTSIMDTEKHWGRDANNIRESNGDPRNVTAKFPVFVASYADGDWGCNSVLNDGMITAGSMPDLVTKINEWSHDHITGEVVPQPLDIGGPDLLDKKPPFVFFTGHKDFHLTDQEVKNLADYLQVGGLIWGDSALPGKGSRFDVAFRREMKRVVPDIDKQFEPISTTDTIGAGKIFTKSWYPLTAVPPGMNYYAEPLEHLDIDGKIAILYTPNDYSDMYMMSINPGDVGYRGWVRDPDWKKNPLYTSSTFLFNNKVFFRNFELPGVLACTRLGMNIIGYILVRFDDQLLLAPP